MLHFLCVGVDLVVRPSDLSITEGGVMEVCVEFAEGQIPAERVVMLSVSETSSMSCCDRHKLLATIPPYRRAALICLFIMLQIRNEP